METITSKRVLHSKIRQMLQKSLVDNYRFPQFIEYCEGTGEPKLKITIELNDEDHFIDEKGRKWFKA